ncbi:zinc finger protein ZAT8-like [Panicum virgatum]|uniref:C2H2-type domain-containing protein n=1 Tax=Panicum virgatum TaxID=38727 RepID=A0A8T0PVG9_PANVG|nr:zinc finger protein ZAT8-like [Panicum virgatum]KAG2565065.1 hypothetical protein PVAP13_7NG057923 [Panicum virgatum]
MATTTARPTPPATNLLRLFLTLSPASRVIPKQQGQGGGCRATRLDGAGEFRCRTCGRAFATFQALGGHRTSHKLPRVRADGLDLLLGARPGKGAAASDVHRCDTCGVVFSTGQALGGHMRRHRSPPATIKFVALSDDGEDDDASHLSTATSFIKFI